MKAGKEVPWDKGFYFIPGFTRYAIDVNGNLKNVAKNRFISWCTSKGGGGKNITGGYYVTNIYSDDGKRKGVSRHRLLSIVFIPCPGEFDDYTVNHKDGVPGNDVLTNLEWVTRSENNQHAYDIGLRANVIPVVVRYWRINEEARFSSISECSRAIGLSLSTLESRLRRKNGVAYTDGLQIKLDDGSDWIDPSKMICKVRINYDCIAFDTRDNKQYVFSSARQAAEYLNISEAGIIRKLLEESNQPYHGYLFKRYGGDLEEVVSGLGELSPADV